MTEDESDAPEAYDPTDPQVPERAPPLRTTAPQSEYTTGQVGLGLVVMVVGLTVTFALPLALTV